MNSTLKKIYTILPKPIQNSVSEIWYRVPSHIKYGQAYSDMFDLLKKSETWSKDQLATWQIEKIKQLSIHAYETTSYYNKSFNDAGFNPYNLKDFNDFSGLPVIDKITVQKNIDGLLSNKYSRQHRQKMTTGGTTGNQMNFYVQKGFTIPRERAFFHYLWEKAGFDHKKDALVVLRNNILPHNQLWEYNHIEHKWLIDPFHLTDENCEKIICFLNEIKIPFFHVYPSSAIILSSYINSTGHRLTYTPKAIFASSENLYSGQREVIEKAFNAKLLLHYGHSEMCCVAPWCLDENHYHINEIYGYTELLDDNDNTIYAPNKIGEITCTGFNNYVFPLIRYKTADYAAYASHRGKCSFEGRVFNSIEGRWRQEMLLTSKGNKISMTSINFHSDIFDNIKNYQFFQDKAGFVQLRIVRKESYTQKDEYGIKSAMLEKLGDDTVLDIQYVKDIEKTANGKFRYVISKIK